MSGMSILCQSDAILPEFIALVNLTTGCENNQSGRISI